MTYSKITNRGYFIALCILSLFIPLLNVVQSVSIMVIALFWLLSGRHKTLQSSLREHSNSLLWIAYFVLHLIGIIYSANQTEAWADTSRKMSFIVLPLLVAGSATFSQEEFERIMAWFIVGNLVAFAGSIGYAVFRYPAIGIDAFFYDSLSAFDNIAVHASWKCLSAIIMLLFFPFSTISFLRNRYVYVTIILCLTLFLILLSSRTLILVGAIIIGLKVCHDLFIKRVHIISNSLIILIPAAALIIMLQVFDSPLKQRYKDVANVVNISEGKEKYDIIHANNYSKRSVLWTAAWMNLQRDYNWVWGCGVGDVQDLHDQMIVSPELKDDHFYNIPGLLGMCIDNMYLQTWLGLGIPGLALLLLILFTGAIQLYRAKSYGGVLLYLTATIFFIQESALQSQAGIVFFTFISNLLINFYSLKLIGIRKKAGSDILLPH